MASRWIVGAQAPADRLVADGALRSPRDSALRRCTTALVGLEQLHLFSTRHLRQRKECFTPSEG
ncbi:MAG: hypothetical protein HXY39_02770 [Chloroflexi bacterium]|nr:hypothetical protein [Chloroflexota bacterium]